jgi:hypothetical protein
LSVYVGAAIQYFLDNKIIIEKSVLDEYAYDGDYVDYDEYAVCIAKKCMFSIVLEYVARYDCYSYLEFPDVFYFVLKMKISNFFESKLIDLLDKHNVDFKKSAAIVFVGDLPSFVFIEIGIWLDDDVNFVQRVGISPRTEKNVRKYNLCESNCIFLTKK